MTFTTTAGCLRRSAATLYQAHVVTSVKSDITFQTHSYATKAKSILDCYSVLGVTPKSSPKQIKAAYYRMSKMFHPDVNPDKNAQKKFAEISEAYEILSNSQNKRMYDRGLHDASFDVEYEEFIKKTATFGKREGRGPPPTGKTNMYDFDAFYREHYGDSLKQAKERKQEEVFLKKDMDNIKRGKLMGFGLYGSFLLLFLLVAKRMA